MANARSVKLKSLPRTVPLWARNPRVLLRIALGTLLAADLVTAALVFKPWAASAQDLERQAASLRQQLHQKEQARDRLRGIVSKVETARADGDSFMDKYLMSKRTVSSNLLDELEQTARKAGIRQKNANFVFEPVEGSDSLVKATITTDYEGTYADLIHFLNLLDRSPRFLITEYLEAKPQQAGTTLGILLKLDAFVREGGPGTSAIPVAEDIAPAAPAQPAPQPAAAPPAQPQTSPGPARGFAPTPAPAPAQAQAAPPPTPVQRPIPRRFRHPRVPAQAQEQEQ